VRLCRAGTAGGGASSRRSCRAGSDSQGCPKPAVARVFQTFYPAGTIAHRVPSASREAEEEVTARPDLGPEATNLGGLSRGLGVENGSVSDAIGAVDRVELPGAVSGPRAGLGLSSRASSVGPRLLPLAGG